jgi:Flp pilus assembly protein TadD
MVKAKKHRTTTTTATTAPTIQALLDKAQTLLAQCDYPLALRFIQRILEQEPGNVKAREMKGVAEIESGDVDRAREVRLPVTVPYPLTSVARRRRFCA